MRKALLALATIIFSSGVFSQKLTEVKTKDLPKPIEKYMKDNMPGTTIFKAVKLDDKGKLTYNVAIDDHGRKHVFVFDRDGKFLKKGDVVVNSGKNVHEQNKLQPQNQPVQNSKAENKDNPK